MLYGTIFGIGSIISYIQTNNLLYKKFNLKDDNKERKIYEKNSKKENIETYLIHPFNIKKYSVEQKIHYFFTIIIIILINILGFESYLNGYTKLYINYNSKELIYVPIDIIISLLINSTGFYLYHRLAHTKLYYKYIHKYHHAFCRPEPFDSLIGHPIDHMCAGLCQILPMYIYEMHLVTFLIYSSLLSMQGIYEHSGIKLNSIIYDTLDHHIHHLYPTKNYQAGFPVLFCDKLFGTYKKNI